MLVPDRRVRLLDQVRRGGSAEVSELAALLGVSPSTVRRDLILLEREGQLLRTHGGAYLRREAGMPQRDGTDGDDAVKQRIGQAAVEEVSDGMTVMILEGSTTRTMLPHLLGRSITVVTNALRVAAALQDYPTVSVVMLGGLLNREHMTFLGPMSEQSMDNLHVDVIFAGAWGIDAEAGVTGTKIVQAGYHHSALRHTRKLVVLADATKCGRRGSTVLAAPAQVDCLITDRSAPEEVVSALRSGGSRVVLC